MSTILESDTPLQSLEAEEIDRQLAKLLESHHFSRSTRYPALLQFLVRQVQMGHAARLKERLIGIEVFHRTPDYDTNTDPVVRVTAAEVRKRIAQYYQEAEHAGELRIDLPIGSYIPRFLPARPTFYSANGGKSAATPESPHPEREHDPHAGETLHAGGAETLSSPAAGSSSHLLENTAHDQVQGSVLTFNRRRAHLVVAAVLLIGSVITCAAVGINAWRDAEQTRALHQLWAPMNTQGRLLFVIGDHSLDGNGHSLGIAPITQPAVDTVLTQVNLRSQVPLEDLISLDKIHSFLTHDNRLYRDKGAAEAALEDLRGGPVVLFAGFDNRWSVQLSQQLPYRLESDLDHNYASIVDAKTPSHRWGLNFAEPVNQIVSDYGVVARYYDPMLEHNVLLVAGIGSMGTAAASEFVTEDRFSREIVKAAPAGWKNGNFEIVLNAPVVDGQAGPPRIVASAYW